MKKTISYKVKAASQVSSTSISSQSNVDDVRKNTFALDTLSNDQKRKIVVYAVSMKAFVDGKLQPQQFDKRFFEFMVRGKQVQATYYEEMNAYGILSNPVVNMTVKSLDNEGTYQDTHNELSSTNG